MILSKSCVYAIRAALYVTANGKGSYVSIREIAEKLDIPFHFLTKILQTLTENNLMTSFRGAKGGVALARAEDTISLIEIVKAVDGMDIFKECVLGLPNCGFDRPCPLHDEMVGVRDQIKQTFEQTTLGYLAKKTKDNNFRISALAISA